MTSARFTFGVLLLCLLTACSSVPRIVKEYRIDVQQGNVLTQEMVSQLRPGLSKDQVRFVLGTPVLTDMFHASRWDYVYWLKKGSTGEVEKRQFSTFFDPDGRLLRVAGDVTAEQPSGHIISADGRKREIDLGSLSPDDVAPPPVEEKGFFGRLLESIGL